MTATPDYYGILGVQRSATADEIKAVYRELAKLHHPDVGGDPGVMAAINLAYEVLSEFRAEYDSGTYSSSQQTPEKAAKAELFAMFSALVDQDGADCVNIKTYLIQTIQQKQKEMLAAVAKFERKIEKHKQIIERMSGKEEFTTIMRGKIDTLSQQIQAQETRITQGNTMIELLSDFNYNFEPPQVISGFGSTVSFNLY